MTALIAELEVIPIITPGVNADDCDGAADTVVVRLTDDDGRTGIGEADAPSDLVRAFVEQPDLHVWSRNVRNLVVGRDPFPIASLVDELYAATLYPGRRGLGIHALSAIDIALHDLVGKQLGRPVYELLGGARKEWLSPYATIFPACRRAVGSRSSCATSAAGSRPRSKPGSGPSRWSASSTTSSPTVSSSRRSAKAGACSATTSH